METSLITKLQDKDYRDAFIASLIKIELPFQIRALREERGWTQKQLAEKAKMLQPRISAIETPGKGKLNLETLLRLASAFDVGVIVRFARFTEVVEWVEKFSPDTFSVKSFEEDTESFFKREQLFHPEAEEQKMRTTSTAPFSTGLVQRSSGQTATLLSFSAAAG